MVISDRVKDIQKTLPWPFRVSEKFELILIKGFNCFRTSSIISEVAFLSESCLSSQGHDISSVSLHIEYSLKIL